MNKKLMVLLAGMTLLAACGGGGSSGVDTAYKGVTTQATVTAGNARALSEDAYFGSQLSSSVSGVGKMSDNGATASSSMLEISGLLERSVQAAAGSQPKSSAKAVAATAQNTIYGYSGYYTTSINVDTNSGAFSGSITFSDYMEYSYSPTLSGPISFSGVINLAAGSFTSLNITVNNLHASYVARNQGSGYTLTGSETLVVSGATANIAMSMVLTEDATGRTYWMRDFALTLTSTEVTMSGTYYDPIHGFVVISTVTPLAITTTTSTPTAGQLLFTGSNGTKARLTFTASGYTVEVDTAGSGSFAAVP